MQHTGEKKFYYQEEKNIDEIISMVSSFHYEKIFYKATTLNYAAYYKSSFINRIKGYIKFYDDIHTLINEKNTKRIEIVKFDLLEKDIVEYILHNEKKRKSFIIILTNDEIKKMSDEDCIVLDIFNTVGLDIDCHIISYNAIEKNYTISEIGKKINIEDKKYSQKNNIFTFVSNSQLANDSNNSHKYIVKCSEKANRKQTESKLQDEYKYLFQNRYVDIVMENGKEVYVEKGIDIPQKNKLAHDEFKNAVIEFTKKNNLIITSTDYRAGIITVYIRKEIVMGVYLLCRIDYSNYLCRLTIGYDGMEAWSGVWGQTVCFLTSSNIHFTRQLAPDIINYEDIMADMEWFDTYKKEIPVVLNYYYDLMNEYAEYYKTLEPIILNQSLYIKKVETVMFNEK